MRMLSRKNLWEKTPASVRSTLGRGLGLVSPAWLLGGRFRSNRRFVSEAQWWSAERAREYQLIQLGTILERAYEDTRFYRESFDRIGFHPRDLQSLADVDGLPLIDKATVLEHLANMRSVRNIPYDYTSTGGTSGQPLQFYINSDRSSTEYAYLVTSWERAGYRFGMPMAVLRGRVVKPDRAGFYHEYDPVLRHHYYSNFHLSDENAARYVDHISRIGNCVLHVYPSSIAALCRFILRQGQRAPENVKGIIAESEIVYPEQREMVEAVFNCRYFSCYGHTEKLVLGSQCERSNDCHVWPTYGYFELLDEQGKHVCTPGQRGEIVGTGFINTVMPFIRYRTGDWATYVGDHCQACGREHILIREIRGHRTQEVLVAVDGSEISWTAMNMHDDTFIRVQQFQFMQKVPGQAILRVVPGEGFCDKDITRIRHNLGRKLDGRLTFAVEIVEAIALTAGGKAIYVDQRIPREDLSSQITRTP